MKWQLLYPCLTKETIRYERRWSASPRTKYNKQNSPEDSSFELFRCTFASLINHFILACGVPQGSYLRPPLLATEFNGLDVDNIKLFLSINCACDCNQFWTRDWCTSNLLFWIHRNGRLHCFIEIGATRVIIKFGNTILMKKSVSLAGH